MSTPEYTMPVRIEPTDIDFMGHVNDARYLQRAKDVVLHLWRDLDLVDEVASKAWVALKHELSYRNPVLLDDAIVGKTGSIERINRDVAEKHFGLPRKQRGVSAAIRPSAIQVLRERRCAPIYLL